MRNRVFVSCCYSESLNTDYRFFLERLERSLDAFCPDADRLFWVKEWPPNSPCHQAINYAFKYYAVKEAFAKGYRYVMWLDAGVVALRSIDELWDGIYKDGYILLRGADCLG